MNGTTETRFVQTLEKENTPKFYRPDVTNGTPIHLRRAEPHAPVWHLRYLWQNVRTALPLALSDQLVMVGALLLATWCIHGSGPAEFPTSALAISLGCSLFIAFIMSELYPGVGVPPAVEVRQCLVSTSLVFAVFVLATRLSTSWKSTVLLITAWLICLLFIPLCRQLTRRVFSQTRWWMQPVLIFGHGHETRFLLNTLTSSPHLGLTPIGVLDDVPSDWDGSGDDPAEYLGPPGLAPEICRRRGVYRAIVAMPDRPVATVHEILSSSSAYFPHLLVIQKKRGLPLLWTSGWDYGWHSGVQVRSRLLLPVPQLTKRAMDLLVVIAGIPLLVPLVLLISAAIKFSSPGPVFYSQTRIGRGGRRFRVWKFRTMVVGAERLLLDYLRKHPELREEWENDHKLRNDPRVPTWIGRFLRKSSLDELPQLWNVFKGEMSLVGPRPLPEYHLEKFNEDFRQYREKIAPGMTGLWQVSCRTDGDLQMIVKWDTYYIRNWSLWLDLQILFRTPKVVVQGDGAY